MTPTVDVNRPNLRPPSDVNPRTDPPLDFPDRDFGELTPSDYHALGFMAGLEVHQQLATASKLFCRCPAGRYVDGFDAEVLRHMRPTLSELGEYDGTALMEFKTRKEIVYRIERDTVCTYEIDDTPPFEIDHEAVGVALEISRIFDLDLVSELHVMRKQYLDGSIPTGFQRTAMIGLGGAIPFVEPALGVDRMLRIRQLSLEEDSCREVSDIGHRITFRTDRLGMPLTEVVTEPEARTPLELQAVARLVARATRACGKVRRGPGAARQDVNVSVAGGRRIELKGVGHHRGLPRLVHVEAFRQLNLLRARAELQRRGVTAEMLVLPREGAGMEDSPLVLEATAALSRCDYAPLRDCLGRGEAAAAVKLPAFAGLLTRTTQPGITFASELSERVRVIACLTSRPCMIHSDIEGYGLSHAEWRHLRRALKAQQEDALVVLWGPARDVDTAAREVLLRARDALAGIPAETRQTFPDGTTGFERILPGADRMYPDTDTPPLPIPDSWVTTVRAHLPERPWDRERRYRDLGLDAAGARRLGDAPWADLYDELRPPQGAIARRLAAALEKRLPHWWRRSRQRALPQASRLAPLIEALKDGRMRIEATERVLDRLLSEPQSGPEEILAGFLCGPDADGILEERVAGLAGRSFGMRHKPASVVLRWATGQVFPGLLGRLDPSHVRRRLEQALGLPQADQPGGSL